MTSESIEYVPHQLSDTVTYVHTSIETGSGHPGHVLSRSDPDTKLSGFDPDSFIGSRALITSSLEWKTTS